MPDCAEDQHELDQQDRAARPSGPPAAQPAPLIDATTESMISLPTHACAAGINAPPSVSSAMMMRRGVMGVPHQTKGRRDVGGGLFQIL